MDNTALNYCLNLIEAELLHFEAKINGKIEGIKGEIEGIKGEIGGIKTRLNVLIALNVSTLAFMLTMILNSVKHWW